MHLAQAVEVLKRQCSVVRKVQLKYSDQVRNTRLWKYFITSSKNGVMFWDSRLTTVEMGVTDL